MGLQTLRVAPLDFHSPVKTVLSRTARAPLWLHLLKLGRQRVLGRMNYIRGIDLAEAFQFWNDCGSQT